MNPALAVAIAIISVNLLSVILGILQPIVAGRAQKLPRPLRGRDIEFVIVSRASEKTLQSLIEVIEKTRTLYPDKRIWVVVDHDSEGLSLLRSLRWELGFQIVVVPADYRRGRHKARAIQYFIDNYVRDDMWYVFLDDDSYPVETGIEEYLDPRIPVYNGIIFPRKGKSRLAWLADSTRFFHSITRNRMAMGYVRKPLYGLHGELLVAHGSVLRRIEFATDSIVEDTNYAGRLMRAGIPVGRLPIRVSILSPNSVVDLWRQRTRWNIGVLRDIVKGRYPRLLALYRGLDAMAWLLSPFLFPAFLLAHRAHPHLYFSLVAAGLVLLAIGLASHLVLPVKTKGIIGAIEALVFFPITLIIQALGPIYAMVMAPLEARGFILIDKNVVAEENPEGKLEGPLGDPQLAPLAQASSVGSPDRSPYRGFVS